MLGSMRLTGFGALLEEKFAQIGIFWKSFLHVFAYRVSIAIQGPTQTLKLKFDVEKIFIK